MSEGDMQSHKQTITGTVTQELISPGSKSEHLGLILRTTLGQKLILRRTGSNAFRDEVLEALLDKTIIGTGIVAGQTFIMQDWKVKSGK